MSLQPRIQRMLDREGESAPAWRWMGLKMLEAEHGRTLISMTVVEDMRNHQGVCHGGFLAMLADSAMGSSMATVLPEGERHMSFDLKVTFMKPFKVGDTVLCEGRVIHSGRRTGVAEATLTTADGALAGTASASFVVYWPEQRK